ncbi:MAG: hypothetical protein N3A38_09175, partial [Planctomycetota bacterium]|nr:hypothetical protein [Planctomycetota bacterium]
FHYSAAGHKISMLEPLIGREGVLAVVRTRFEGLVTEDRLIYAGAVRDGDSWLPLEREVAEKLAFVSTSFEPGDPPPPDRPPLSTAIKSAEAAALDAIRRRNEDCYDTEMNKLENYAMEALAADEKALAGIEKEWEAARRARDSTPDFARRKEIRREIHRLELEYARLRDRISRRRAELFEEKGKRMSVLDKRLETASVSRKLIAAVRWRLL